MGYDLLIHLLKHDDALAFAGYYYYIENEDLFWAAPIRRRSNDSFVVPSSTSISDQTYPLIRSIYMNLLNDPEVLELTIPLVKFGLAHPGFMTSSGFVPLPAKVIDTMIKRLDGAPYESMDAASDDDSHNKKSFWETATGISIITVMFLCMGALMLFCCVLNKKDERS